MPMHPSRLERIHYNMFGIPYGGAFRKGLGRIENDPVRAGSQWKPSARVSSRMSGTEVPQTGETDRLAIAAPDWHAVRRTSSLSSWQPSDSPRLVGSIAIAALWTIDLP